METAALLISMEEQEADDLTRAFEEEWMQWRMPDGKPSRLPAGWRRAVRSYHELGMGDVIVEAIEITMSKRLEARAPDSRFKYFCGVMRMKYKQRQEKAKEVLAEVAKHNASVSDENERV